jgi:hypothetical protein
MHGASHALKRASQAKLLPRDNRDYSTGTSEARLIRTRLSTERLVEATTGTLCRSPECNAVDPFYILPIREASRTQFLVHYCKFPFSPMPIKQEISTEIRL